MNVDFFAGSAEHGCAVAHQVVDVDGRYLVFASPSETQKLLGQARRTADTLLNGFDVFNMGMGRAPGPPTSVKLCPECPSAGC